jgi:hypothetical protein
MRNHQSNVAKTYGCVSTTALSLHVYHLSHTGVAYDVFASTNFHSNTVDQTVGLQIDNCASSHLSLSSNAQDDNEWPWRYTDIDEIEQMPRVIRSLSANVGYVGLDDDYFCFANPSLRVLSSIADDTHLSKVDPDSPSILEAYCGPSGSPAPPSSGSVGAGNTFAVIGSVLMNGKFKCNHTQCEYKMFSRPAELKRHHATTHAYQRPQHWCPSLGCERSMAIGSKAFSRKDKLKDHLRQMHGKTIRADGSVLQVEL